MLRALRCPAQVDDVNLYHWQLDNRELLAGTPCPVLATLPEARNGCPRFENLHTIRIGSAGNRPYATSARGVFPHAQYRPSIRIRAAHTQGVTMHVISCENSRLLTVWLG